MTEKMVQYIIGGLLLLAILGSVVALGLQHILQPTQVYGILTTIIAIAGAIFAVGHGAAAATKAVLGTRPPGDQ